NDTGCLACEHSRVVGVTRLESVPEAFHYDVDVPLHLLLATMPPGNKAVVQDANDEFRIGPVALSGHVDRPRLHRRVAVGPDDRLTESFRRFGLLGRDETRADQNA